MKQLSGELEIHIELKGCIRIGVELFWWFPCYLYSNLKKKFQVFLNQMLSQYSIVFSGISWGNLFILHSNSKFEMVVCATPLNRVLSKIFCSWLFHELVRKIKLNCVLPGRIYKKQIWLGKKHKYVQCMYREHFWTCSSFFKTYTYVITIVIHNCLANKFLPLPPLDNFLLYKYK